MPALNAETRFAVTLTEETDTCIESEQFQAPAENRQTPTSTAKR